MAGYIDPTLDWERRPGEPAAHYGQRLEVLRQTWEDITPVPVLHVIMRRLTLLEAEVAAQGALIDELVAQIP